MYAEKILHILKNYVEREFNGNVTAAGSYFGINPHTLRRWLLGDRTPTLNELGKPLISWELTSRNMVNVSRGMTWFRR